MNKLIGVTILLSTLVNVSYSQNVKYAGVEGSVSHDYYIIHDPCKEIEEAALLLSGSFGFFIAQSLNEDFLLETGIIFKYYTEGFQETQPSFANRKLIASGDGFPAVQIPIRLRTHLNLIKNRLFLSTVLGYHLSINTDYKYNPEFYNGKYFSLIEAGAGFEYFISENVVVSLIPSYFMGFSRIYEYEINTSKGNCTTDEAISISNGSYLSILSLGLKYRISDLWHK
ncbi:MAG: hypothetical protein ACNS62_15995 [Candidatus Cyclobacteriaceae bacterium M3_2C_046]